MNEELKIIIKAKTDEAKKQIGEVRKELENMSASSSENKKRFTEAMGALAKGAAVAMAAVAGLAAAMTKLAHSATDVNKGFAKLNTTFQSMGSTTAQATKTYKELFGFLGEHDKAIETAQSLALITTEEKKLAEWSNILKGAYAAMGEKLPTEGLAEAANETIKTGIATGQLVDALTWMGVSEDGFNAALAQTTSLEEREVLLRNTLNGLYGNAAALYDATNQTTIAYNKSQANLNVALSKAAAYVTPFITAINNLGTTFLTYMGPAIRTVAIYLTAFIQLIAEAIVWVSNFFGLFSNDATKATADVEGYQAAMSNYLSELEGGFANSGDGIDDNIEKLEKLKKQTMGFDELNVVSSPSATGSTGATGGGAVGGGALPKPPNPADYGIGAGGVDLTDMTDSIAEAQEKLKGMLVVVGAIAAGLGLWKLIDFIAEIGAARGLVKAAGKEGAYAFQKVFGEQAQDYLDDITTKIKTIAGVVLAAVGVFILIKGVSDAWANGIDWGNFATMLGGIALIIAGLAISFGTIGAGIGAVVGGIVLLVVGIKDLIENGYSMEAVLTVLAGVILVVVGVCLAFNAALLANPITWIIIAIAALVAAFVVLWNECEGFRNFWKALWEKVKELFSKFMKSIEPLIDSLVGAFKEAWEVIKVIWNNYLVPLFKAAWEAIKAVWDFVKPYFATLWENIKVVFSAVKEVLAAYFTAAWEAIKIVWNQVVSYFTAIWDTIKGIFSVVKNVLQGNWQEAWDGIKGIVNTWKDYFANTWENIKKIFGVVGTFFKTAFSSAWEAVKKVFNNWGTFFSGLWNKIKTTFSKLGSNIASAIGDSVKSGINGVISMIENTINKAIGLINGSINLINKLPGVSVSKVSTINLPRLAKGGVVDSATIAMIGEQGKEVVMPLENNTEWMDRLADRIAARNSSPSKIVLQVGEREIGWATIDAINKITKQTGGVQLVI